MGFMQLPNSPCILTKGPNKNKIHLGLYVDDFLYFSQNTEALQTFETKLKTRLNFDFDEDPNHFLGLKLDCTHNDKEMAVTIS